MKTQLTLAALVAALGLPLPASAADAAESPLSTPAASPPPSSKLAAPARPPAATLYGFVNFQWSRTDAPFPVRDASTLETRRARIGARGDLLPQVGYVVLFDAADTSLKDAYGALKNLPVPGLEVRAGQWKTPFGYEQQESDTRLLWVNGSYAVQALARSTTTSRLDAAGDARDVGVGIVGRWPVGSVLGLDLAASVVNGAGPNRRDDLDEKNAWGRAGLSAKAGPATLKLGGSFGYGHQLAGLGTNGKFDGVGTPVDDTSFYFRTYGGDVTLDTPWVFAAVEVIQSERDVWNRETGARPDVTARGWYAGAYGKTPWKVGPVVRVEQFDRNRAVSGDRNERVTVGAYVDVVPVNARLVLNWELDRSQKAVRAGDRAVVLAQVIF